MRTRSVGQRKMVHIKKSNIMPVDGTKWKGGIIVIIAQI